jgi:hypothetical protein
VLWVFSERDRLKAVCVGIHSVKVFERKKKDITTAQFTGILKNCNGIATLTRGNSSR